MTRLPTEPILQTAEHLLAVQRELMDREPIFHRPEFGTTRSAFEAMMAEDFWEIGASGQRYSRAYVLDVLETRHSQSHTDVWQADDFYCQEIAPNNYLLTYTLKQDMRVTRRMTLWRHSHQGWLIVFHQGTVVQN